MLLNGTLLGTSTHTHMYTQPITVQSYSIACLGWVLNQLLAAVDLVVEESGELDKKKERKSAMNREDEDEGEGIEPSNVVLSLFSAHPIDCAKNFSAQFTFNKSLCLRSPLTSVGKRETLVAATTTLKTKQSVSSFTRQRWSSGFSKREKGQRQTIDDVNQQRNWQCIQN